MNKAKRLYFGQYMNVYVLVDEHSDSKVNDALKRLDDSMRAKLVRTLRLICETANYRNKEKLRYEGNGIYAIKVGSMRLLGFFLPSGHRKSQLGDTLLLETKPEGARKGAENSVTNKTGN